MSFLWLAALCWASAIAGTAERPYDSAAQPDLLVKLINDLFALLTPWRHLRDGDLAYESPLDAQHRAVGNSQMAVPARPTAALPSPPTAIPAVPAPIPEPMEAPITEPKPPTVPEPVTEPAEPPAAENDYADSPALLELPLPEISLNLPFLRQQNSPTDSATNPTTAPTVQEQHEQFQDLMAKYGKTYASPEEAQKRFVVFQANSKTMDTLRANEAGTAAYGMTKFFDLTPVEFLNIFTGRFSVPTMWEDNTYTPSPPLLSKRRRRQLLLIRDTRQSFDWRNRDKVTAIKDQGDCGVCWIFGAVATIESHWAIRKGPLSQLSEQQVADCQTKMADVCGGGYEGWSFDTVKKMYGIQKDKDYPYKGEGKQKCRPNVKPPAAYVNSTKSVPAYDEKTLLDTVLLQGPTTIAIDATPLQFYVGGIMDQPGALQNHVVAAIGYGVDDRGHRYWTLRNSWGTGWGEKGYFRLGRGTNALNMTGSPPLYPIID